MIVEFKAQRTITKEWVYGYFIKIGSDFFIYDSENYNPYLIIPETLCLFTNMYDIDKTKIWENDIIEYEGYRFEVAFTDGAFELWLEGVDFQRNLATINSVSKVIGNTIDSKQLLFEGKHIGD